MESNSVCNHMSDYYDYIKNVLLFCQSDIHNFSIYIIIFLIITITISSNVIGALTALFFTNQLVEL